MAEDKTNGKTKALHYRRAERVVKGFANHRRIEMLAYLDKHTESSLEELCDALGVNIKTASQHLWKLANAGLVEKRNAGRAVRHRLSGRGKNVLIFLRKLDSQG